ncbi:hypothetical protein [Chamaesiphon sp.]
MGADAIDPNLTNAKVTLLLLSTPYLLQEIDITIHHPPSTFHPLP